MNTGATELADQRQEIRERLQAQRQRIALQLAQTGEPPSGYPRSMTMRFFIRRPELLLRLAALMVGPRLAVALPTIFLLSRNR
jgi:hypothetical protein